MSLFRELEALPIEIVIESLDEYLRVAKDMYIDDKWYSESEITAYVHKLEAENAELRAVIARNSEEEYE